MSIENFLVRNYKNRGVIVFDIRKILFHKDKPSSLTPKQIRDLCVSYEYELSEFLNFIDATTQVLFKNPGLNHYKNAVRTSEFYTFTTLSFLRAEILKADPFAVITPMFDVEETRSVKELSLELSKLASEVCTS